MNIKNYTDWLNEANISKDSWSKDDYQKLKDLQFQNLQDLIAIFNKHNAKFWVDCGTLLGIYRDKAIIDGDSDCDVGILAEDITPELIKDLQDRLVTPNRMFYDTEDLLKHLETDEFVKTRNLKFVLKQKDKIVKFKDTEISCDIFLYFPHEDYHMFKYGGREQYIRTKSKYILNLGSMQFKGVKFKIPSNVEKYLEQLYGEEWNVPDPTFDYRKNKPWCLLDLDEHYFYNFKTKKKELRK